MEHYRVFECTECEREVKLYHSYTGYTPTTCANCGGRLKDTGREYYDIYWAIDVGVHRLFNWRGYQ